MTYEKSLEMMENQQKIQFYDLIEFHFNHQLKKFVKYRTHKTNQPKAICYSEKSKIIFLTPVSRFTRFRVVKNGELQYSNSFKKHSQPRQHEVQRQIQTGQLELGLPFKDRWGPLSDV